MYEVITILAAFGFVYSLAAGRLERTPVNGPVVYLVFGVLAGPIGFGFLELDVDGEAIRTIAELTLALVLFADAANADLPVLRRTRQLPARLLLIGLPLTILLGIGVGRLLMPQLAWIEVALLATMLAPTDAALGQAVVENEEVPAPVRQGLNVESGLNDGICVPVLLTFLAIAGETATAGPVAVGLSLVAEEIGIGAGVGVSLGVAGAWGVRECSRRGFLSRVWLGVPVVALALTCFALAQLAGGSGFIACFSAGLVFGGLTRDHKREVLAGAEGTGRAFALVTWVVFGAAAVGQLPGELDWRIVAYALLSLTVVRMLPVWLSLLGEGCSFAEKVFVGWFGPRGLASVVFAVIVAGEKLPGDDTLAQTVVVTVVLSILLHGISANPLARAFGREEGGS